MMRRTTILTGILLLALGGTAAAQTGGDPTALYTTRPQLEALLQRYESEARTADDGDQREQARRAAALIRSRLEAGDFRVGDRITLVVEGEPALTDTFTVQTGQMLVLPVIGDIPLRGVLRSQLEPHLTSELRKQIRDPVVHARALIQIVVSGEVGQPGFFELPAEARVTDVLMAAGGPVREARMEGMHVERDGEKIIDAEALNQAISEGRTLDQLNLRAGDRIEVPRKEIFNLGPTARWLLLTAPALIIGAFRVF